MYIGYSYPDIIYNTDNKLRWYLGNMSWQYDLPSPLMFKNLFHSVYYRDYGCVYLVIISDE